MQLALFGTGPSLELLPAAMRNASGWKQRTGETQCSWCGWREGYVRPDGSVLTYAGRTEATWHLGYEDISWAGHVTVERVCPFCVHRPTDLGRAIEVARLVVQAKEGA